MLTFGFLAPVRNFVEYEGRIFEMAHIYLADDTTLNLAKPTRFNGPPSPELEAAWDDLVQRTFLIL